MGFENNDLTVDEISVLEKIQIQSKVIFKKSEIEKANQFKKEIQNAQEIFKKLKKYFSQQIESIEKQLSDSNINFDQLYNSVNEFEKNFLTYNWIKELKVKFEESENQLEETIQLDETIQEESEKQLEETIQIECTSLNSFIETFDSLEKRLQEISKNVYVYMSTSSFMEKLSKSNSIIDGYFQELNNKNIPRWLSILKENLAGQRNYLSAELNYDKNNKEIISLKLVEVKEKCQKILLEAKNSQEHFLIGKKIINAICEILGFPILFPEIKIDLTKLSEILINKKVNEPVENEKSIFTNKP